MRCLLLRTRPPVSEEGEEIGCADEAVAVEVFGASEEDMMASQMSEKGHYVVEVQRSRIGPEVSLS